MKKQFLFPLLAFAVIFASSCSKSPKDVLKGSWTVSKLSMAGTPQDPELLGPFMYDLNEDGSYNYSEGAKKETGKWSVSEDNKVIHFEPAQGEKYTKGIKSMSPDSVVLEFKSFTMDVDHVLVPVKK